MSNARNLANLLGTDLTIPTAKIADSAITAAKVASGVSLFKRIYTANITTPQEWVNGFVTISTLSNVVVNSGEQVYLSHNLTARNKSSGQHHTAYRIDWQLGGTSGFVGQSGWGFGIHDTLSGHQMDVGFMNLSTWPVNPFNQTGTFTFYFKGRASSTNGYWGAEANGVAQNYEVGQVNILVG